MIYNKIGDLKVSLSGLGTVKFGRNFNIKYPRAFDLPSDGEILDLLSFSRSLGINYLDTAPAYGNSEQRIGELLRNREKWVISTKIGEYIDQNGEFYYDFSEKTVYESIINSLGFLMTDYVDIVYIHSDGRDLEILNNYKTLDALDKLKKMGVIRYYGFSIKVDGFYPELVDNSDVIMVTYNSREKKREKYIDYANNTGCGVVIKKPLYSGHLTEVHKHFKDILAKEVSSILFGTINMQHLYENVSSINLIVNERNGV